MAIDPVIILVEELRAAEATLRGAAKEYVHGSRRMRAEAVNRVLSRIKTLNHELLESAPTSALGAAELIRLATERLPGSHQCHADRFSEIARRLSRGQRHHADLVWLRAMQMSLAGGPPEEGALQTVPLLRSAISGAARPVLVFRAVTSARYAGARLAIGSPPN